MRQRLLDLAARIDNYSLRERIIFMILGAVVLFVIYDYLLVAPLLDEAKTLSSQLERQKNEITQLRTQQTVILERARVDPDADNKQTQTRLTAAIDNANQQLQRSTAGLISPTSMPVVLEGVLKKISGLELEAISLLPPRPLAELLEKDVTSTITVPGVYQHGLKLTFSGNYLDTLAYLQALESLDSRFYWGGVSYEVTSYPDAQVTLIVNTLSLNEAWIGI